MNLLLGLTPVPEQGVCVALPASKHSVTDADGFCVMIGVIVAEAVPFDAKDVEEPTVGLTVTAEVERVEV